MMKAFLFAFCLLLTPGVTEAGETYAYWKRDRVKYLSEPERHKDHCELRSGTIEAVQAENKKNSRYLSKRDVCDSQVVKNDPEGEEDCDLFGPGGKVKTRRDGTAVGKRR